MLTNQPMALLVDITRCVGCRECVGACLTAHDLPTPPDEVKALSSRALTNLVEKDGHYLREMCRHCVDPSCASVCPVEAFKKLPNGPVVYEASRCLGCRYCMQACPFGVPKYEWESPVPKVVKCDFCAGRQAQGKPTACSEACPAEATVFGTREAMLAEARRRIAESPADYYPAIWGDDEIGGTSMLFLSPLPFEQLGLRTDLGTAPLSGLTDAALSKIPGIVSVGGALLMGLWWITHRREAVSRFEAAERETSNAGVEVTRDRNA